MERADAESGGRMAIEIEDLLESTGAGTRAPVPRPQLVNLFGVDVAATTMDEAVEAVRSLVRAGGTHQHVVLNAAKVVELERSPELLRAINSCSLVNADGASVVWASRLLGRPLPERVAGIDLFVRLVEAAAADGDRVYFLGARPEVVEKVVHVFRAKHPALQVAGWHDGYWDDDDAVVEQIRRAQPHYLFLAIPSPRKELWLNTHLERLAVPFVMGVGGSFDVVAGKTKRAPVVVQKAGFEWAWRLGQEPRRMWRRYLYGNAAFARITAREWLLARRAA